jgi:lysophospholipid acyltransferase (LPLAT)-like uncharacterized protein
MAVNRGKWKDREQNGSILYRFSLWAVPLFFRFLSVILFATCRVERRGYDNFLQFADSASPFIAAFWHYGVIYIVHQARDLPYVAMVSPSKDGEYISRILQSKGFATVRGSRSKGGIGALKGLIRQIKNGKTGVLVADGSQGPAREAQPGAVMLASYTGVPIVPLGWAASHYWTFRSWDKTALPKPFSRIVMLYGEPLHVPKGVGPQQLEEYRLELEKRLNGLYEKGWAKFGKKEH